MPSFAYTAIDPAGQKVDGTIELPNKAEVFRRLEKQALLTSEWREEGKRRKRFYSLSPRGKAVYQQLLADWQALNRTLDTLTGGAADGGEE